MTLAEAIKEVEVLIQALGGPEDEDPEHGTNHDAIEALQVVLAAARKRLPKEAHRAKAARKL